MSPRILYAAFDLVPSPKGASTHITYFTRGLVAAGYEVTLLTAGDPGMPPEEQYAGATLLRAPAGEDLNFLSRAVAFGRFAREHLDSTTPYDLVHFRSIWSGFPLAQARPRFGYRILYEVNGLPSVEMKYHYPTLGDSPVLDKIKEQELATLHLADRVICPSQVTAGYLQSLGLRPDKITVIPNGVDADRFGDARPRAGTEEIPTLLYVGTLAEWQGLSTLIDALPLILAHRPVRLRILGRGRRGQRKRLLKQARKLGLADVVSLERAVPHEAVPAELARAAICLAPLGFNDRNVTQGCCPLKILEYMAAGRPIVAANLPVVRELAREGLDALLFTPDNPAALARQVLTLLENPGLGAALGQSAARRVRSQFSWQRAQEHLLAVVEQMLDQPVMAGRATGRSPGRRPAPPPA